MSRPPDEQDQRVERALKWLDRAPLSRRRLLEKMQREGWDEAESRTVADRLAAMGVMNDEAMARALIEELQLRRHAGPALLRSRLRQRGLDDALIERLLQETEDNPENDPMTAAGKLVREKLRSLHGLTPPVKKRRLWGLLARRGYDSDTIEQTLAGLPELQELNDEI